MQQLNCLRLGTRQYQALVIEVSTAIVNCLWDKFVCFPTTDEEFKNSVDSFEMLWQFPYRFGTIDGFHLPIKCPLGGQESGKEQHNFKNFYSIVLKAIVGSDYQFYWGSCGIPGNTHDSSIFQAPNHLYAKIIGGNVIPQIGNFENERPINPLIVGNSAFPFRPWLLKSYTNTTLSPYQRYFYYQLLPARMVTEGAYGQLKARWRLLMRKCETLAESKRLSKNPGINLFVFAQFEYPVKIFYSQSVGHFQM